MRVKFNIVGDGKPDTPLVDVDLPVIPAVDDTVEIPGIPSYQTIVRTIVWYPYNAGGPFVYIVLGPRRPSQ